MTRNKKKLRRAEKRYSVTKSAQTLVLAGLLLAGGVGSAFAATTWGDDKDVIIAADETLNAATEAKNLTINSGTLTNSASLWVTGATVLNGGTLDLTVAGGLVGTTNGGPENFATSSFTMNDGTLNVGKTTQGSMLQMDKITISGGTVTIQGKMNNGSTWLDNSMIYGGVGDSTGSLVVISGDADITINNNGQIGVGYEATAANSMDISGGKVTLAGDSAANAAMLRASSSNTEVQADAKNYSVLNISKTATLEVADSKHGAIVSRETNMSGGTLNVAGSLVVAGSIGSGTDIADGISKATKKWGNFNLTDGEINVAEDGKLSFTGAMAFNQDGGTVNNAGRIYATGANTLKSGTLNLTGAGGMIGAPNDAMTEVTGTFTMTGGELNVGDGDQGSQMQMDKVTIAGGNVNIQGKVGDISGTWTDNSMIYGGMGSTTGAGVVISGGTVTIGNNGQIGVGYDSKASNSMDISGGKVILQGDSAANAAMLRASSSNSAEANASTYSKLNISNAAAIEVAAGKYGAIISRETNMSGGTLNVDGSLVVAGSIGAGADITKGIAATSKKWGAFNLSGGAVNVGTNGLLDFATGNVDLNAKGGALNTAKLTLGSAAPTAGATGTYAQKLNVSAAFNLNDLDIKTGGTASVTNTGSLVVGGKTTLVTGGTLTNAGKVTASFGDFLTTGFAKNADMTGTLTNSNGTLYLRTDAAFTYTKAQQDAAKAALTGSVGFLGGTLVDAGGKPTDAELTASGGSSADDSITPNNGLVVTGNNSSGGAALSGEIAAKTITVDGTVTKLTVTDTTLTGSGSGSLVSNGTGTAPAVALAANGTLNLGIAGNLVAQGGSLGAVTTDSAGGTINTNEGNYTVASITGGAGNDNINVNKANLEVTTIVTGTGNDTINVSSGNLTAGTVTLNGTNDKVNVGNSSSAGTFTANTMTMGGGTLFLDPAWVEGQEYQDAGDASRAAIAAFTAGIDGNLGVGQNSQLSLGTANVELLTSAIRSMGNVWGKNDITAALGIYSPQTLASTGAIMVDGTKTSANLPSYTANSATFADKSLLAVYAPNTLAKAALTAGLTSTITVNAGAKLMVVDGKIGQTVKITEGFGTTSGVDTKGWNGTNLITNSDMIKGEGTWTGGKYDVKLSRGARAQDLFPLLDGETAGIVDKMYDMGVNNTQSSSAGIKFLSRASANNEKYVANATEAAATIEGAARLAVVGATQGITMSAVTAGSSAATSRTSMASPLQSQKAQVVALNGETSTSGLNAGDVKNGVGLWIMPLYQSNNAWGMKAGEFKTGYTSDLGGVAIGADYTFAEAFRVGVAFNIGGGYAQSQGDFNKTDNNFNFWGVNLYGGWSQNNFGITADVGYTSTYSKLEQELQSSMDMGALKADVTSSAITAGLRGEYKFETDALDIIPHVGVRYMSLMTDSYDAKSNGTVFSADESYQSIWTFPIGVTLTKDIVSSSGWTFKPQLDLQIIPAAGDVKAKSKVRVPGIDASADLSTRVMDDITYGGGVGFDIRKDNVSFGVNYNLQASEHSTAHGVFATVRYEF